MTTKTNIAGLTPVEDPEYRYKMPAVFGEIKGSGNSTAVRNITEVAKSLRRSPGEVNKFFGIELGARAKYNPATDRFIVSGAHADGVLQKLIHRYIEKFVLCPNCGLPETKYKIRSNAIYHKCDACGAEEMDDMSHKLCNYIVGEHKKNKTGGKSAAEKDDKIYAKEKHKDGSNNDEKKEMKKKDKKRESCASSKKNVRRERGWN
jgi:translation initiation factor 5